MLLDSVQAQANRLEEALQRAIDSGSLKDVPVLNVDFTGLGFGRNSPEQSKPRLPFRRSSIMMLL